MVTFTRRHYEMIGEMLRELDHYERKTWFYKWDRIFKADNPRYQHDKFLKFVFQGKEEIEE